jgi:hypothetical protein
MKRYPLKTLLPLGHQLEARVLIGYGMYFSAKMWCCLFCTKCGVRYYIHSSGKTYDLYHNIIINLNGKVKASGCDNCTNYLYSLLDCDEQIIKDIIE